MNVTIIEERDFNSLTSHLKYLGEITSAPGSKESMAWGLWWDKVACEREGRGSTQEELLVKAKDAGATHIYFTGNRNLGGMVDSAIIETARIYKIYP